MNHAAVIEEIGALPQAQIEASAVKSTRENLEAAIKGETYERDTMYPDFLKQARADRNSHAVRTLNLARTAETEHARLYETALANLDRLKGTKEATYYVCPVCGYTSSTKNALPASLQRKFLKQWPDSHRASNGLTCVFEQPI